MLPVRTLARQPLRSYRPDMSHLQLLTRLSVTVGDQR
jgi:hypothetical protein